MAQAELVDCNICGMSYMSNEKAKHNKQHEKFLEAQRKYPFISNYANREVTKREAYSEMIKPYSDEQIKYAIILVQTYFSRDYLNNPEKYTSFDEYMIEVLNNREKYPCKSFNEELFNKLYSLYIN